MTALLLEPIRKDKKGKFLHTPGFLVPERSRMKRGAFKQETNGSV